jgi:hypothetical protein
MEKIKDDTSQRGVFAQRSADVGTPSLGWEG